MIGATSMSPYVVLSARKAVSDFVIGLQINFRDVQCQSLSTLDIVTVHNQQVLLPRILYCRPYCTVFIHFYSTSHSMSLSETLPTVHSIDTVSEFTRRRATGNCK